MTHHKHLILAAITLFATHNATAFLPQTIYEAASTGDVKAIHDYFVGQRSWDLIDEQTPNGWTLLKTAIFTNQAGVVDYLLLHGAMVNLGLFHIPYNSQTNYQEDIHRKRIEKQIIIASKVSDLCEGTTRLTRATRRLLVRLCTANTAVKTMAVFRILHQKNVTVATNLLISIVGHSTLNSPALHILGSHFAAHITGATTHPLEKRIFADAVLHAYEHQIDLGPSAREMAKKFSSDTQAVNAWLQEESHWLNATMSNVLAWSNEGKNLVDGTRKIQFGTVNYNCIGGLNKW